MAYRVCSKARLAAQRRTTRETKRAKPDSAVPVPDSRWDEALAAVQEEVARLPENLRVPFVVCCLEGMGVVEAAKMLGWKLGTLSGRLTRAKDRLLTKLEARGVVMSLAGFVAGLALVNAPAASVTKAMLLSTVGAAVPTTILQLSSGVIGMGSTKLKLLLAGLFVASGLGLGVGTGWINTVGAQQSGGPAKEKIDEKEIIKQKEDLWKLDAELKAMDAKKQALQSMKDSLQKNLDKQAVLVKLQADEAKTAAEKAQKLKVVVDAEKLAADKAVEMYTFVASDSKDSHKWQYDIVPSKPISKSDFVNYIYSREKDGWEFVGSNTFLEGKEQVASWVFRKSTEAKVVNLGVSNLTKDVLTLSGKVTNKDGVHRVEVRPTVPAPSPKKEEPKPDQVDAEVAKLRAQIEVLTAQLKKAEVASKNVVRFLVKDNSKEAILDAVDAINTLGVKKFPNDLTGRYDTESSSFVLSGSPAAVKWATGMLDKLVGQRPAK